MGRVRQLARPTALDFPEQLPLPRPCYDLHPLMNPTLAMLGAWSTGSGDGRCVLGVGPLRRTSVGRLLPHPHDLAVTW